MIDAVVVVAFLYSATCMKLKLKKWMAVSIPTFCLSFLERERVTQGSPSSSLQRLAVLRRRSRGDRRASLKIDGGVSMIARVTRTFQSCFDLSSWMQLLSHSLCFFFSLSLSFMGISSNNIDDD